MRGHGPPGWGISVSMATHTTAPRNLESRQEHTAESGPDSQQQPGRWEREAEELHTSGPEDSVTRSSRIYFFVIVGIVAASFIVFLLLRPS